MKMRKFACSLALVSELAIGMPLAAADDQPAAQDSSIIVRGSQDQAAVVTQMAKAVTVDPPVDKPVARFNDPVCFGAFGAKGRVAHEMLDRMGTKASEAGLRVGGSGCQANILVGFVSDPEADIRKVRKQEPGVFAGLTRTEMARALREAGPVKVLISTETRTDSGEKIDPEQPTNKLLSGSRIGLPVQRALTGVIVLYDRKAAVGKTTTQLADYAMLRALATLRPEAAAEGAGPASILSLFAVTDPPEEMTEFDRAYLRALYAGPPNVRPANLATAVAREFGRGRN